MLLVWAGQEMVGERWWVTTWALYLPQPIFLAPSLLLIAAALLRGRWRVLLWQIGVALIGAALLIRGGYRLPRPPVRGDLRVMTWNVRSLTLDPKGVLATIRRESPDVLLLQEAVYEEKLDPIPWLKRRLPGWRSVQAADVAILSPHSLGPGRAFSIGPAGSHRLALRASARVRGRRVEFITVHYSTALPRPLRERIWHHPRHNMQVAAAVRIEQTANLAAAVLAGERRFGARDERSTLPSGAGGTRAAGGPGPGRRGPGPGRRPLVVGGDFNSPPGSHAYKTLDHLLGSAFASGGSGFGWTFPARRPLLRIDHLFVSDDLRVLNCRVLPVRASDHRPVVADLAWR